MAQNLLRPTHSVDESFPLCGNLLGEWYAQFGEDCCDTMKFFEKDGNLFVNIMNGDSQHYHVKIILPVNIERMFGSNSGVLTFNMQGLSKNQEYFSDGPECYKKHDSPSYDQTLSFKIEEGLFCVLDDRDTYYDRFWFTKRLVLSEKPRHSYYRGEKVFYMNPLYLSIVYELKPVIRRAIESRLEHSDIICVNGLFEDV